MRNYRLALTEAETALVARIDLRDDIPRNEDAHAIYLANCEPILELLESLHARKAIPAHRMALWNDPKLHPGNTKGSYQDIFSRNGSSGSEAYIHPNFKRFLRYFLYGADLPEAAIEEFEDQVGDPRWFSGSDIIDLAKKTRAIVRKYNLRQHDEEFLKLALDNGLSAYDAMSVRRAAIEAARR